MKLKYLILAIAILLSSCEKFMDTEVGTITIESVTLEKMPIKKSDGASWDEISAPDVFFWFEETSVNGGVETDIWQDLWAHELPVSWTMSPTFTLSDLSNKLKVYVYDADLLVDDLIATAEFEFDPTESPDVWTLDLNDDLQITIEVSYTHIADLF